MNVSGLRSPHTKKNCDSLAFFSAGIRSSAVDEELDRE
jgi:hypothetical protein